MKKRIVLLGGDLRQYYMAKSLIRKDFAISYYGLNFPQEEQGAHQCRDKGALWSALREADALVAINIYGEQDLKIFEPGVAYFK